MNFFLDMTFSRLCAAFFYALLNIHYPLIFSRDLLQSKGRARFCWNRNLDWARLFTCSLRPGNGFVRGILFEPGFAVLGILAAAGHWPRGRRIGVGRGEGVFPQA